MKACLLLSLMLPCVSTSGQQTERAEFISLPGRFGIKLPATYADYTAAWEVAIGGQKFYGSSYRWKLDAEQVVVSYADGAINYEASQAENLLHAICDDYVQKAAPSKLVGEKITTLAGHPGLVCLVQAAEGRTMCWVYVVNNRFYLLSLTLKDAAKVEEHVQTLATFRLLTRSDLEPHYRQRVAELTPPPLPPEPEVKRPTSDAQDIGLKGNVKQIVTETERCFAPNLFGPRIVDSIDDYDEHGNLTKTVFYGSDAPHAVRIYGYLHADRVFSELRKFPNLMPAADNNRKAPPQGTKPAPPTPTIYTVKYKYDDAGRLNELRILHENGVEAARYVFKLRERKIEGTANPAHGLFDSLWHFKDTKHVSLLDENGYVVEDTSTSSGGPEHKTYALPGNSESITDDSSTNRTDRFKYKYEFDARGNWIKRVTLSVGKGKGGPFETPQQVTYRTITYY